MQELVFVKRGNVDKVDSRLLAKNLGIKDHKSWLHDTVIPNQERVKVETGIEIEFDFVKNKRGPKTRFAWFTESQVYFVITLSKNTTEVVKAKSMMANATAEFRNNRRQPVGKTNQWTERKNNILTTRTKLPKDLLQNKNITTNLWTKEKAHEIKGFFSPDIIFAEFLETLEGEISYSMAWNWSMMPTGGKEVSFPATDEQAEILNKYNKIAKRRSTKHLFCNNSLPLPPTWHHASAEETVNGVVWVNYGGELKKAFDHWVERAGYLVEIYESDEWRREFDIPSKAQEGLGCYETPKRPCTPVNNMFVVTEELEEAIYYYPKISGFQVHKDWLEWLALEGDAKACAARKLFLDRDYPLVFFFKRELDILRFQTESRVYEYGDYELYDNFFKVDDLAKLKPNPNPPMFERVRFYRDKYRPIFEWYFNNVWLPQHSTNYLQAVDPEGFPKLVAGMRSLPESTTLPRQFVDAMQPLLTAAE
jgi:hypothetical protein